jgi:predicted ribosome quality control (RQC) complex YloA/Tae2 family protein
MKREKELSIYTENNEAVVREDIDKVITLACKLGDITKKELMSGSRKRLIGDVRICIGNLLRRVFGLTQMDCGKYLGRDHASIVHYEKQHEWMIKLNYYKKIYNACVEMACDRTFDSDKVKVTHHETINRLKSENAVLTKRVKELSKQIKQYEAIKENILNLQMS